MPAPASRTRRSAPHGAQPALRATRGGGAGPVERAGGRGAESLACQNLRAVTSKTSIVSYPAKHCPDHPSPGLRVESAPRQEVRSSMSQTLEILFWLGV